MAERRALDRRLMALLVEHDAESPDVLAAKIEALYGERLEYRLRWQRVQVGPTSQILQTERGALEKAERMLALDETKADMPAYASMPDLVWMRLEARGTGPWRPVREFDVPEPDPDSARVDDDVDPGDIPF